MVVHHRRPFWTLLASLTTAAFIYLTIINTTIDQGIQKTKPFQTNVKNVVAYSLLKQIEIESEQYTCDGQSHASETDNYSAINESVEAGNDNDTSEWYGGTWTQVGRGGFYVFSAHMDRRLDPYHFVRIIGVIKDHTSTLIYIDKVYNHGERPAYVKHPVSTTPVYLARIYCSGFIKFAYKQREMLGI